MGSPEQELNEQEPLWQAQSPTAFAFGYFTHPEDTSVDEFKSPSGFNHITSVKVSCGRALGKMQFSFYFVSPVLLGVLQ